MSTHEMSEAEELCDRIAILYDGHILVEGSPREIVESVGESSLEKAFIRLISNRGG
jgi:ABC-type Na+ transport system ATPase subunit NatA